MDQDDNVSSKYQKYSQFLRPSGLVAWLFCCLVNSLNSQWEAVKPGINFYSLLYIRWDLVLKYLLKSHVLKTLSLPMALLEKSRSFRAWDLNRGGVWLEHAFREYGKISVPSSHSLSLPGHHEVSNLPLCPLLLYCLIARPKQHSQVTVEWNFWNSKSREIFHSSSWLISGILSKWWKDD